MAIATATIAAWTAGSVWAASVRRVIVCAVVGVGILHVGMRPDTSSSLFGLPRSAAFRPLPSNTTTACMNRHFLIANHAMVGLMLRMVMATGNIVATEGAASTTTVTRAAASLPRITTVHVRRRFTPDVMRRLATRNFLRQLATINIRRRLTVVTVSRQLTMVDIARRRSISFSIRVNRQQAARSI